jgi:hypothetical protein
METLAPVPANADLAPVENAATDVNASTTEGDGSAPSVPEADTPAPKKDAVQERIDKLTREKYDALRERDRRDYEIERLRAEVEQFKAPKAEIAPQNDFPTLEQYGYDEGKYQAAVASHYSKIAAEQGTKAAQAALQEERARQQQEQANKSWATKEAEFLKSKPDYAEKVKRDPRDGGPIISQSMAQVIMESGMGPQLAYHLAENVAESALIAQMPPLQQARELGRIEAKLELAKAPPKPVVSQAPPPVGKVEAADVKVDKEPSQMSDAEFAKWRKRQIAQRN